VKKFFLVVVVGSVRIVKGQGGEAFVSRISKTVFRSLCKLLIESRI